MTHLTQPNTGQRIFHDFASSNQSDTSLPAQSNQSLGTRPNPLTTTITPKSTHNMTEIVPKYEAEVTYNATEPSSAQSMSREKITQFMVRLAKQSTQASRRQEKSPMNKTTKIVDYPTQDENICKPENG